MPSIHATIDDVGVRPVTKPEKTYVLLNVA